MVQGVMKSNQSTGGTTGGGAANKEGIVVQETGAKITPELLALLINNMQTPGVMTGGTANVICYQCRLAGHRANACTNQANPQLVEQIQLQVGRQPCRVCGKWGHQDPLCWNKLENAHL